MARIGYARVSTREQKMGKPKLKHNNRAKPTAMLYENGMGIEDEPRNNRCASA